MSAAQKTKAINDKGITKLEAFAKTKWGVTDVDLTGLDARAISGTFKQMDKVIKQYPTLKNSMLQNGTIRRLSCKIKNGEV